MAEHFYATIINNKCVGVIQYFTDEEFPTYVQSPDYYYVILNGMDTSKIGKTCINGKFK